MIYLTTFSSEWGWIGAVWKQTRAFTDLLRSYDICGDNTKAKEELGWEYDLNFFDVLDMLINEESVARKKKSPHCAHMG